MACASSPRLGLARMRALGACLVRHSQLAYACTPMSRPLNMPEPRPIHFLHRGAVVAVADAAPTRTVLEWLREDAHCTGTKEGCAEGDCGACTVVIGELADAAQPAAPGETRVGGLSLRTVNACIQFLPALDGKALFTVEDLKPLAGGALHPVQEAMVECHGSQCGFCTPGFVMSLSKRLEIL